jgi:hypothetical protein
MAAMTKGGGMVARVEAWVRAQAEEVTDLGCRCGVFVFQIISAAVPDNRNMGRHLMTTCAKVMREMQRAIAAKRRRGRRCRTAS